MKTLLCIAVLSAGMISASDWYAEKNLEEAKKLAMDYFWKQIHKVNGEEVVRASRKFKNFFKWEDEDKLTFVHAIVCRTNNTRLLEFVLGLGNSYQPNSKGQSPRGFAEDKPEMKELLEEYNHEAWASDPTSTMLILSEETVSQQKTFLVFFVMLGIAYYGWNNYNTQNNPVLV